MIKAITSLEIKGLTILFRKKNYNALYESSDGRAQYCLVKVSALNGIDTCVIPYINIDATVLQKCYYTWIPCLLLAFCRQMEESVACLQ